MNSHSHGCDSCAKVCEEAKLAVKNLQKKVYALTIVCTSALTLLGEQGAKAVLSTLNSMNDAMAVVDGKAPKSDKEKKEPEKTTSIDKVQGRIWSPKAPVKEQQGKFENDDLVAVAKKKAATKEKEPEITIPSVPQRAIQNIATTNNQNLSIETPINANPFNIADPYAVFLTPSTLPFDVYSTTLALGNNYGFGEYYGMGTLNGVPSVPDPKTISVFALGGFLNSRKRN